MNTFADACFGHSDRSLGGGRVLMWPSGNELSKYFPKILTYRTFKSGRALKAGHFLGDFSPELLPI
jgi:hypothetical protein